MHKKIFFISSLFFLTTTSCKKYLEEKQSNIIVSPNTIQDLQALLDNVSVMNQKTPGFGEASADDYFLPSSTYTSIGQGFGTSAYSWTKYPYYYSNDWSNAYAAVYVANLCLEKIDNVSIESHNNAWKNVKGSALFYRAFNFLNMVWQHAKAYDENSANSDLGIPLRMTTDINQASIRASVRESYDRIISDLKNSIELLPDLPQHFFRPSKCAAYGLLARTYLSMRKYDDAFQYANLCLQLKGQLMNYANNPPVIPNSPVPFPAITGNSLNTEIIFYATMYTSNLNNVQSPTYARIDSLLFASYDQNDVRKTAFFALNNGNRKFKGSYAANPTTLYTGISTDEMYLIRAECSARRGDKDEALSDLNDLLSKRWKNGFFSPITAPDSDSALTIILKERRKELLMRGLRWIDIKRLNKEGRSIILKRALPDGSMPTLQPGSTYYALPIPTDIVDLTGIPQNE